MGFTKDPSRLPSFGLQRVASRARDRSPPIELKPISAAFDPGYEYDGEKDSEDVLKPGGELGRRIMIVIESSQRGKGAVKWALSYAVQSHDTVVLLQVARPSKNGGQSQKNRDPMGYSLLCAMKNLCQAKKPEVQVEVCRVEGKERGPAIVAEARRRGVSLLVLGQRKRSAMWRLLVVCGGDRSGGGGVVEYCVDNASCMALAVRRKGGRASGYLITTRQHKDFWLLA